VAENKHLRAHLEERIEQVEMLRHGCHSDVLRGDCEIEGLKVRFTRAIHFSKP
jgi:hypothetical protein